jgi:hypothetical protein
MIKIAGLTTGSTNKSRFVLQIANPDSNKQVLGINMCDHPELNGQVESMAKLRQPAFIN